MPSITHAQFDSLIGANGESVPPSFRPSVREHIAIALAHFTGLPRWAIVSSLGSITHSLALSICAQRKKGERYVVVRVQGTRRLGTPLPRAFSIKPAKYPSATPTQLTPAGGRLHAQIPRQTPSSSLLIFVLPTAAAQPLFVSPRSHDPVAHPYHAQAPVRVRSVCPSLCDVVQNNLTAE